MNNCSSDLSDLVGQHRRYAVQVDAQRVGQAGRPHGPGGGWSRPAPASAAPSTTMADRTISNPERGCGHLKRGKAYARGVVGSPDGVLPSFVRCDPPIPYREMGTEGSFTRGFLQFDGVSAQFALDDITDFVPLYPGDADDQQAVDNMIDRGLYPDVDEAAARDRHVPDFEGQRHVDRIRARGTEGEEHFGAVDAVRQSDLLMRAGKTHYPEPDDYIQETVEHGISKAIPLSKRQEPPVIQPGGTRMWIVHPQTDVGWAVIGYAYLQEIVFTEPADGNVPEYVQEYASAGRLDVVDIEEPEGLEGNGRPDAELADFDGASSDPDPSPDPSGPGEASADGGDQDADPGGSDPQTTVPAPSDSDQDVVALQDVDLDDVGYNDLKRMAGAIDDISVGQNPTGDELQGALELYRDGDDGGQG